jgi:F0F1-type ATP synthase membrane subunit c/vacuolar-type H+-ATPase subunit K
MGQQGSENLQVKGGIFTTEFWKSFIYAGISIATGLGAIGPSVPDKYKTVIDSAAFLAGAICLLGYSLSRGKTIAAAVEATASVLNATKTLELQREVSNLSIKKPSGQVSKSASAKL